MSTSPGVAENVKSPGVPRNRRMLAVVRSLRTFAAASSWPAASRPRAMSAGVTSPPDSRRETVASSTVCASFGPQAMPLTWRRTARNSPTSCSISPSVPVMRCRRL